MPRSILLGRVRMPGEPLFLGEDTDAVMALAEEERDTCPSCGMPRAWCRTADGEAGISRFDVREERCWATFRLALREEQHEKDKMHPATRRALQMTPRFREGHEPDFAAGLNIIDGDGGAGG